MRSPSRRDLGRLLGASALAPGALLPRLSRAGEATDRRFLFVFVNGGWDPTFVFTPEVSDPDVWVDPTAQPIEAGGHVILDAPDRPQVRAFFQRWGDRTALMHGIEVRSVTHEACRRIVLTGGAASDTDDWPARIAAADPNAALPDLVISGPAFTARHTGVVTRVGPAGQLGTLLSGPLPSAPQSALPAAANDAVEAFLRGRADAAAAAAEAGHAARFAGDYAAALDRLPLARSLAGELDLSVTADGWYGVAQTARPAIDCFAAGLARCAVVEHLGEWDVGWDTHSGIARQSDHFRVLFTDLDEILGTLERTPGPSGAPLLDDVTVVVFSEMGRAPGLNALGGKDHWTFTSAMLIGSGVRGGGAAGGYADGLIGAACDLSSGAVSSSGTRLTSSHLGATLLALAGLDAATEIPEAAPVTAVLAG